MSVHLNSKIQFPRHFRFLQTVPIWDNGICWSSTSWTWLKNQVCREAFILKRAQNTATESYTQLPVNFDYHRHIFVSLRTCHILLLKTICLWTVSKMLANDLLFLRRQMGDWFLTRTAVVDCDSDILSRITEICKSEGIAIEVSPPYAHEANGGAESSGNTLMTRERCMRVEQGFPSISGRLH